MASWGRWPARRLSWEAEDREAPYVGQDAGYLVIAFGQETGTNYTNYSFDYRRVDGTGGDTITYDPSNSLTAKRPPDFKNRTGYGNVETVTMQPGNYVFYNLEMLSYQGPALETFKVKNDFAIPFTIRAGEATYVGQYMALGIMNGKQILFGIPIPAGANLLVSDQKDFDIGVARTPALKIRGLPAEVTVVNDATPDPEALGVPILKTDPNPGGLERESIPAVGP